LSSEVITVPHGVMPPEQFRTVPCTTEKSTAFTTPFSQSFKKGLKERSMRETPPGDVSWFIESMPLLPFPFCGIKAVKSLVDPIAPSPLEYWVTPDFAII